MFHRHIILIMYIEHYTKHYGVLVRQKFVTTVTCGDSALSLKYITVLIKYIAAGYDFYFLSCFIPYIKLAIIPNTWQFIPKTFRVVRVMALDTSNFGKVLKVQSCRHYTSYPFGPNFHSNHTNQLLKSLRNESYRHSSSYQYSSFINMDAKHDSD